MRPLTIRTLPHTANSQLHYTHFRVKFPPQEVTYEYASVKRRILNKFEIIRLVLLFLAFFTNTYRKTCSYSF